MEEARSSSNFTSLSRRGRPRLLASGTCFFRGPVSAWWWGDVDSTDKGRAAKCLDRSSKPEGRRSDARAGLTPSGWFQGKELEANRWSRGACEGSRLGCPGLFAGSSVVTLAGEKESGREEEENKRGDGEGKLKAVSCSV